MNLAEALLLGAVLGLPLLLGAVAGYLRRPWWWAALAAIAVSLIAAIAPEPEPGEPRVATGDIGFLLVIAVISAGLAWVGGVLGRRLSRRPRTPR